MCANVTPKASPSPAESTGRTFLSRLASPLKSSIRFFSEFYIRPFEPHRHYAPGDAVKGLVVLAVVKPFRITHLTVALHGFVHVYKNHSAVTHNLVYQAPTGSSNHTRYFGNGRASLFQDEVILCGEGRFDVGVYEFEFDLYLPSKGLPTSIDFESGTISYMVRATLTRPTSITPTSTCDRKILLLETIDIGPMVPPKPSIISLEPISKRRRRTPRSKPKTDHDVVDAGSVLEGSRPTDSPIPEDSASQRASLDHSKNSRSPVGSDIQSEASAESVNSSKQSVIIGPALLSPISGHGCQDCDSQIASKTITASVELLRGGYLPGDNIPLKVSIQHTKRIKSMNGIIATLYRQGRIDSAPPLSLFTDVKGKEAERLKHEEYYPKSKTGLGGLSLSSAGSSSVFRKDLSQTVMPIIINPSNMTTVVTASVRVPENAFPTIVGVPGQMISFRYHVEVVVDLGGKLAGHKKLQRNIPPNFGVNGTLMFGQGDVSASVLSAWEGSIVDTDYIRREKDVVACLFEVVVGTKDSARLRGRQDRTAINNQGGQSLIQTPQNNLTLHDMGFGQNEHQDSRRDQSPIRHNYSYPQNFQKLSFGVEEGAQGYSSNLNPNQSPSGPSQQHPYTFSASPEMLNEGNEKDRMRIAEEALLPSQPPQDGDSTTPVIAPSAPDGDFCEYNPSVPLSHALIRQPGSDTLNLSYNPSTPSTLGLGDLTPIPAPHLNVDKQELERRRLIAETSSPSDFPEDQEDPGVGSSQTQFGPTAPVLTEEEYGGQYTNRILRRTYGHNEFLPKYER